MKKIKVGDKVRCLFNGYDFTTKDSIYLVTGVTDGSLSLIDNSKKENSGYSILYFEPVTKTLDDLEVKEQGYKLKEEPEPEVKKAIKLLEGRGYKVEK